MPQDRCMLAETESPRGPHVDPPPLLPPAEQLLPWPSEPPGES